MKWLRNLWYARLRRIDMQILWPSCVKKAKSLDHAKAAFAVNAFHDRAWMALGEQGVYDAIDSLTEAS